MKGLFLVAILCFSNSTWGYHFCKGQIEDVWVESDGDAYINGTWAGHTQICKIGGDWKGVNTEVCKAWLSLAQVANASDGNVVVRYYDEDITSCSEIPSYGSAPKPNYIMLDK